MSEFEHHTETQPSSGMGAPDGATRVVVNSAWSFLAQGASAVVGGGVSIYAIRSFTTTAWGHYSTASALVALATVIAGAGLSVLSLREMSSTPREQDEIVGLALSALAWTSVFAVALLIVISAVGFSGQIFTIVLVLVPLVFFRPGATILAAAFNARSAVVYSAWFQIVQTFVYGGLAIGAVVIGLGVRGFALATTVGATAGASTGLVLLRRKLALRPRLHHSREEAFSFIRAAAALGAIGLVGVVYDRVDVLMLSAITTASKVAHYTVPYAFVRLAWIFPSVVSVTFFPVLNRRLVSDPGAARNLFLLVVRMFLFISLPLSLALTESSRTLLPDVFGGRYGSSVPVLEILAWSIVLTFLNYLLWYGLIAVRQERPALLVDLGGLSANVTVNALAIPALGARGAAAALIVSEAVVLLGQSALIHRRLFALPVRELLAKPVAAAAVAVPSAIVVGHRSPVAGGLTGGLVYVAILLGLGYVRVSELRPAFASLRPTARP